MKKPTRNDVRLAKWIKTLAYSERDEGTFTKIAVRQILNKSKSGDEVARFQVPQTPAERAPDWEMDLANEIINAMSIEASTLGGMQNYACYAIFSEYDGTVSRCIISVDGGGLDADEDDLLSEGPNSKGQVAQAMRHSEAFARILTGSILQVTETQRRQIDKLMATNESLAVQNFSLMKDLNEFWDQRRAMMLEEHKVVTKTKAMEEGMQMARQLLPLVINKMAGKNMLPVDKSIGLSSIAKSLYGSLSEEQIAGLNQILRTDQFMQFMTLGESLVEETQEETSEKKANEG